MLNKPEKQSVAIVIWDKNHKNVLLVKRPFDDANLPGYWGFPAASKNNINEDWESIALKAGQIKLGCKIRIIAFIGEDTIDRGEFILRLRDYEVEIVEGNPSVPQKDTSVTQYIDMEFSNKTDRMSDSAKNGSLCTKIFLKSRGINYLNPEISEF